jgi:hypothetical protein
LYKAKEPEKNLRFFEVFENNQLEPACSFSFSKELELVVLSFGNISREWGPTHDFFSKVQRTGQPLVRTNLPVLVTKNRN